MDKTVHEIASAAIAKRDVERLQHLQLALTTLLSQSRYVDSPEAEREEVLEQIELALAKWGPKPRKAASKPPRAQKPVEILSGFDQADLFADPNRWPRKPYCTNDLEAGVRITSLRQAIEKAYIQANPPHLRVWALFDIDRPAAATAWEDAHLPPPAWTSINRENGHAHMSWGLTAPVLVESLVARDAPLRYLAAVESMMREKLAADAGYNGLITKNPAHPLWHTLRGPRMHYQLSELAAYLPGLEKHRPRQGVKVECVGLGRNVQLFDVLRKWAYKAVRAYWEATGLNAWNAWLSECNTRALMLNADLFGCNTLDGKEVWHIAKSVAKWTWRNTTSEGFSSYQATQGAKGGVKSGEVRRAASEDKRVSARLMAAAGMSVRDIAKELEAPKSSVHRWTADVEPAGACPTKPYPLLESPASAPVDNGCGQGVPRSHIR